MIIVFKKFHFKSNSLSKLRSARFLGTNAKKFVIIVARLLSKPNYYEIILVLLIIWWVERLTANNVLGLGAKVLQESYLRSLHLEAQEFLS